MEKTMWWNLYEGAFAEIVNVSWPITIFAKSFVTDVWQGLKYAPDTFQKIFL